MASRIHETLRRPFTLYGTEFFITASLGVSLFPDPAEDARTLLKQADAAMYRAKQRAPGGTLLFPSGGEGGEDTAFLATTLRAAVDRQDWALQYQPIVDLDTGKVVGAEALVRLRQPDGRLIPASDFIPLAEETGAIADIGDWVIASLLRQAAEWSARGLKLALSFNLSARQLWQPGALPTLLGKVSAAGVDPGSLIVEIAESTITRDPDRAQRALDQMSAAGLRLAIDDFGTGYLSLSRLRNLPVDVLKIDRRFIRNLPEDSDAASMVKAAVGLAASLSMQPLAEGIERPEQRNYLLGLKCRLGQGYLFGLPTLPEDLARFAVEEGFAPLPRR